MRGQQPTKPFDKSLFKAALDQLRELTKETNPDIFMPVMVEACANAGVAVVFEPVPTGCPASGATKWIGANKALLMLSFRHKTNDHFWFSFFHEAAHLLLHGKKMMFIESKVLDNEHEKEANDFAKNILIPKQYDDRLMFLTQSVASLCSIAEEIGIAPGIVVGRMQNDGLLRWDTRLNSLKVRYEWNHQ